MNIMYRALDPTLTKKKKKKNCKFKLMTLLTDCAIKYHALPHSPKKKKKKNHALPSFSDHCYQKKKKKFSVIIFEKKQKQNSHV